MSVSYFRVSNITEGGENKIPLDYTTSVSSYELCYQLPLNLYPFKRDETQTIKLTMRIMPADQTNLNVNYTMLQIDFSGGNKTGLEPNVRIAKDVIAPVIWDYACDYCSPKVRFKNFCNFDEINR